MRNNCLNSIQTQLKLNLFQYDDDTADQFHNVGRCLYLKYRFGTFVLRGRGGHACAPPFSRERN